MGIGGHVLGDKKLRVLSRKTGLSLNRAIRRNDECEGVIHHQDGSCTHYKITYSTGDAEVIKNPTHWTSCIRHKQGAQNG